MLLWGPLGPCGWAGPARVGKFVRKCVFLCEEVVSGYDSRGAFTSVIVLVQIVTALFSLVGSRCPHKNEKTKKVG